MEKKAAINAALRATKPRFAGTKVGNGAPGRIRTSGPQIRSLVLYPAELRARGVPENGRGATYGPEPSDATLRKAGLEDLADLKLDGAAKLVAITRLILERSDPVRISHCLAIVGGVEDF